MPMNRKRTLAPEVISTFAKLWHFDLARTGSSDGTCILQAVSWIEYRTLSEEPACVCPVIAAAARAINDTLPARKRQELKPYIPRLIGTVDRNSYAARYGFLVRRSLLIYAQLILKFYGLSANAENLDHFTDFRDPEKTVAAIPHYLFRRPSAKMAPAILLGYASSVAQITEINRGRRFDGVPPTTAIPAAARYAPRRDRPLIYNMMFNILDGLLAIGKQAKPIRREAVIEAVETFSEKLAARRRGQATGATLAFVSSGRRASSAASRSAKMLAGSGGA
jgi:hypothetical protein